MTRPRPAAQHSFRLRTTTDEPEQLYRLRRGDNRLGSSADNEVVIPRHGVSRHHAVVHVESAKVWVQDQDSKNGTFVNGHPISRHVLQPGDELWLGPQALSLESFDPREDELAVKLELPEPSTARVLPSATADGSSTSAAAAAGPWWTLVESFLEHLGQSRTPNISSALQLLVDATGAMGAAVYEVSSATEEPVALGVAGSGIGSVHHEELRAPSGYQQTFTTLAAESDSASTPLTATWLDRGPSRLVLRVYGGFPGRHQSEPLLRLLLRQIALARGAVGIGPGPDGPVREVTDTAEPPAPTIRWPSGYVVGRSAATMALHEQLETLIQGDLPVLITGATGTGKELIAQILHRSTPGRTGLFVAINCAALPAELLEAELFGVGKGVATGVRARAGLFQRAHGGTLFLDEIGELPLTLQPKLLRALQERTVLPLGGLEQAVDVRVLAATNVDLAARAEAGTFRPDLYYRLAGAVVAIPPLRARRQDIPALVAHFLQHHSTKLGKPIRGISVPALSALANQDWPGNIRQLENEVRRLVYHCPPRHAIESRMIAGASLASADQSQTPPDLRALVRALDRLDLADLEGAMVEEALRRSDGNQVHAGRLLGISRTAVRRRMQRHALAPTSDAEPAANPRGDAAEDPHGDSSSLTRASRSKHRAR